MSEEGTETYIRRIREPIGLLRERIDLMTAKRAEYAIIVYGLVKHGAFQIAKNYIDWIADKTEPMFKRPLSVPLPQVAEPWKCKHGHTRQSHPRCYHNEVLQRLKKMKK